MEGRGVALLEWISFFLTAALRLHDSANSLQYSQCLPGTASSSSDATGTTPAGPSQSLWGQYVTSHTPPLQSPTLETGANLNLRCGGNNYNGPTTCPSGAECDAKDDTYSQCLPSGPKASLYQQCGGGTWSGPTVCVVGASCKQLNQWYSQVSLISKWNQSCHTDMN